MPKKTDWSATDALALAVLAANGGVAHLRSFRDAGLTEYQVAAIFRRRVINRPRTGWYSSVDVPWQGHRAVRVGGAATCVTAAALLDLPVPPGSHEVLHIRLDEHDTRLRHNRDKRRVVHSGDDVEAVWHRRSLVEPAVWRTSLVDTLLQLAWCVPLEWLVAAIDAARHRPLDGSREPLMTDDEFRRFAALLPRRFRRALALFDPSAESPLESLLRVAMTLAGIGPLVPQFWATAVHRVDFLVLGHLVIEADGVAWHDPEADRLRDELLRSMGYVVLRFDYDRIVFHIEDVIADIRAALVRLGLAFPS